MYEEETAPYEDNNNVDWWAHMDENEQYIKEFTKSPLEVYFDDHDVGIDYLQMCWRYGWWDQAQGYLLAVIQFCDGEAMVYADFLMDILTRRKQ